MLQKKRKTKTTTGRQTDVDTEINAIKDKNKGVKKRRK